MVWLSFHFLYLVVSFSGGQLSVVGFLFFYIGFLWLNSGTICGFVCYELLILSYLLQMVEEEYGLGRL